MGAPDCVRETGNDELDIPRLWRGFRKEGLGPMWNDDGNSGNDDGHGDVLLLSSPWVIISNNAVSLTLKIAKHIYNARKMKAPKRNG